ncbi:MAG: LysM peptidoglycan-binding domain-containing protein [Desulfitobacteriaceae bacterium]|nr:LysM peptidoglycan-binding domain-containing protein [Desulfitobacteriaceae bacterium]
MADIRVDEEQIMVGSTVLPGIFESIEVEDDTQSDQVEIQGQNKKANQRVAYNPTLVRMNLKLMDDDNQTALDKLAAIRKIYRPSPTTDIPQIYRLISEEAQAHGVDQVTFASLRSRKTNLDDIIYLSLEFEEYVPIKVTVQERPKTQTNTTYTIQSGDTLSALAVKYGTTVQALAAANNIADVDRIYVGQQLVIPAPGSSSGGSYVAAANTPDSTSWTDSDIAADDDIPPNLDAFRQLKETS